MTDETLPEVRDPRLVADGVIACEINHSAIGGWIPFGALEGEPGLSGAIYAAVASIAVDARDPEAELAAVRAGMQLSRRQLLIGLAGQGWITEAEAEADATTRAAPAAVEAAIAASPEEARLDLRITWGTFNTAQRLDPLVALLAAGQGVSDAELDAFFIACSQI